MIAIGIAMAIETANGIVTTMPWSRRRRPRAQAMGGNGFRRRRAPWNYVRPRTSRRASRARDLPSRRPPRRTSVASRRLPSVPAARSVRCRRRFCRQTERPRPSTSLPGY
jgi:hypothetical protein